VYQRPGGTFKIGDKVEVLQHMPPGQGDGWFSADVANVAGKE